MFAAVGELAMLGIGPVEIVVVGLVFAMVLVVVAGIVAMALVSSRKSTTAANSDDLAALRREIDRLREEVERLKKGPDPSTGITSSPR